MLRRFGFLLAALAFFSIAGGQWTVLQTVAWAGMLSDYSQRTGSVLTAIAQTFDGEHPCALCLQIEAARRQETKAVSDQQKPPGQKNARAEKSDKPLLLDHDDFLAWIAPVSLHPGRAHAPRGSSRDEEPPTPPPRSRVRTA